MLLFKAVAPFIRVAGTLTAPLHLSLTLHMDPECPSIILGAQQTLDCASKNIWPDFGTKYQDTWMREKKGKLFTLSACFNSPEQAKAMGRFLTEHAIPVTFADKDPDGDRGIVKIEGVGIGLACLINRLPTRSARRYQPQIQQLRAE